MRYPSYSSYRTVHYEWTDQVPSNWLDKRFRFLLLDGYEGLKIGPFGSQIKSEELTNEGYKVYGQENVINNDFTLGHRYLDEDKFNELTVYEIMSGDLLITMMGTSGKCRIAPNGMQQGIMDSHLIRLRTTNEILTEYSRYLIDESKYVKCQIDLLGKGSIMHGLNSSIIKSLLFHVPPVEEQQKIAAFLDYKTQQIDQLIAKKKTLIEKLEEKRIAVITQAVTKGLDKNVTLKPSGVDWLGDVPEDWQLIRLRFLLSKNLTNGLFKKAEFWGRGKPIVNVFDAYVHGNIINETSLDRVECNEEEYEKYSALDGDFFFVRSSLKLEGVGKSATILFPKEEVVFECHLVRGRSDKSAVDSKYLNLYLNSKYAREYFVSVANVVTMATIDQMKLKNLILAIPDINEQKDIVSSVENVLSEIDGLCSKASATIDKLNEYRSSLITSAVTGKIDVRNVQVPKEVA